PHGRLVVTWRGHRGKDAPEHILTGEISPRLLELLKIPHRVLAADTLETDLTWAVETMDGLMQPVALLVPPGVVEIGKTGHGSTPAATSGMSPSDPARASMLPPTLLPKPSRPAAIAPAP